MADRDNVALVGFMAAGKSTVGQLLAARLGYRLVDTDQIIVDQAGRSIPDIFAAEGETGFRAREQAAVAQAAGQTGLVISCGGGVARDPANVAALRAGGRIVWLALGAEEAARRIVADGPGRPMIDDHVAERTPAAVQRRVEELLAERTPYYRAAADQVVVVDQRTPAQVVQLIVAGESDAVV
ncbi:MAG: shikimate kinase [Armatimonadetes bacterium]|nr:shikimate kinase [Armatimonadota bacterium]